MFKTAELANRSFTHTRKAARVDADTNADCAAVSDSESPYRTQAGRSGRVLCSTDHGHTISWTDRRIVATATGRDDAALYTWWADLVGRTTNPTQQALLEALPAGIEPSSCADNGETSIKCGYVMDDIYAVRYTRYPDAATLASAYASLVDKHDLTPNTPPPSSAFGSCNYETNWGIVDDNGVITQEKGRVACFEQGFLPRLLWTQDEPLILTEAIGGTTGTLGEFFQSNAIARTPTTSA